VLVLGAAHNRLLLGSYQRPVNTAVTVVVAIALLAALFMAVWFMARPLALLLAAIVLANAIAPVIGLWERVLPESWAIAASYFLILTAIVGVIALVVPPLVEEAREAIVAVPSLLAALSGWVDRLVPGGAEAIEGALTPMLSRLGALLIEAPLALADGLVEAVLVFMMAVYWSFASDDLRRHALTLVPTHLRDEAAEVAAEVFGTIGGYLRARIVVGVIVGTIVYVGLRVLGVEYAGVLALLVGVGELVPYLGPSAATIPALMVVLPTSSLLALGVLLFYIVVQQLKSYLLVPTIVQRRADIPPLLVIFALVVGTSTGGAIGAVVAPPFAGALRVVLVRVVLPPLRRWADNSRLGDGRTNQ